MNENEFVHAARLASDYSSMQHITGQVITWKGVPPGNPAQRIYPSRYTVTFNMLAPTINGNAYQHTIEIDCSSLEYPRSMPFASFITPVVKHPHFFDDGRICLGGFPLEESLAELCIRLARFLQYDPTLINPNSIASSDFYRWYQKNHNHLPLDRSPLPVLEEADGGFRVKGGIRRPSQPSVNEPPGTMTIKRRNTGNPPR